jgi:hypothetical protein
VHSPRFRFGGEDIPNGIHWFGKVLTQLSGPYSFRYLIPPRPELPLVILLGDRHGQSHLCDPCEEEKGCMSVFEPSFMQMLDALAQSVPVDFLLEMTWGSHIVDNPSHILFNRMRLATQNCHDVAKRSQPDYHPACPTQFVRWHYAETRFDNPYMQAKKFIEPAFESFAHYLKYYILKKNYQSYFENVFASSRDIWEGVDVEFADTILELLFSELNEDEIIEKMVDTLFYYINAYPSMIGKQLAKHRQQEVERRKQLYPPDPIRFDEQSLQKALVMLMKKDDSDSNVNFYEFFLMLRKKVDENPIVMQECHDALKSMLTTNQEWRIPSFFDTPEKMTELELVINIVRVLFTIFNGYLLDVYAVARMVKMPEKSDRAILHVGYYGDAHCRGVAFLLTQILNYRMIIHLNPNKNGGASNCIKFDKPIYLEEDVRDLARRRYETFYKEDRELLDNYKRTIERESMGRSSAASSSSAAASSFGHRTRKTQKSVRKSVKKSCQRSTKKSVRGSKKNVRGAKK